MSLPMLLLATYFDSGEIAQQTQVLLYLQTEPTDCKSNHYRDHINVNSVV